MKNFSEEIKTYALSNGFEEIKESDITKSEFKDKRIDNPFFSQLFRKEVKDHLFYILVPMNLFEERFYLRVYNRFSESAPRSEHRMRISEFLEYNEAYRIDKNPLADIVGQTFHKLYKDVLNYKEKPSELEKQITRLHVFGADRNLPKSTDAHSK